jgi:hypothetical protein
MVRLDLAATAPVPAGSRRMTISPVVVEKITGVPGCQARVSVRTRSKIRPAGSTRPME